MNKVEKISMSGIVDDGETQARAFAKRLSEEAELGAKLGGLDSEDQFFALAKDLGYDFTKEEWMGVASSDSEKTLTESDLEIPSASGTLCTICRNCTW